jgi:hypothetical protein
VQASRDGSIDASPAVIRLIFDLTNRLYARAGTPGGSAVWFIYVNGEMIIIDFDAAGVSSSVCLVLEEHPSLALF